MSDWQPIETAPRDGTEIFLCWGDNVGVGYFSLEAWSSLHKKRGKGWQIRFIKNDVWSTQLGSVALSPNEPTHWMPLPEPPEED